jgi:hypothetical protein
MDSDKPEEYISYISGGLFGDFFHQLSVIKEKYIQTGKKGILYIANIGHHFTFGLENTYEKTYHLVIRQDYIHQYTIYNGEHYDINLCSWRDNRYLLISNWYYIYSDQFNIEWGKHKWLDVPVHNKWADKILINETNYRFSDINYSKLHETYGDKLIFIAFKETNYCDYETFLQTTGLSIEYYDPVTVYDLAIAINSCSMFVGVPSGIMSVALALKVPIIMGNPPREFEYNIIKGMSDHFSNIIQQ